MKKMRDEIKETIAGNLVAAKEARLRADWIECWQLLEDAHVLKPALGVASRSGVRFHARDRAESP